MLEAIKDFMVLYWHIVVPIALTAFLAVPIIVNWYHVRYWLMKVRLNMPAVGTIAHWVKHPGSQDTPSEANPHAVGFYESEAQLCRLYETYYRNHQPSEAHFKRCQDYLNKAHEANRREKGMGLWALIIALMLIEASAFGFALAPFALTLATPNLAIAGAMFIGTVISIIGLILSEFAGRQLYANSIVNHLLGQEEFRENGERGDMKRTDIITIDNTHLDDDKPDYQRVLNRIQVSMNDNVPTKRYGLLIGYGIFIIGLAIAAFWVRTETLNAAEADLIANPPAVTQSADDFPVGGDDDFPMPTDMQSIANESAGKSAQDQIDAMHRASLVTFAVLSGLFVFIQLVSTFLGFRFGFEGTYSRVAWEMSHKFSSADEFVRFHTAKAREVATDAQASLGKLQAMRAGMRRGSGTDREKVRQDVIRRTFTAFIQEQDSHLLVEAGNNVLKTYLLKINSDMDEAIKANDNARMYQIATEARPRLAQIKDPSMFALRDKFLSNADVFAAVAPAAPAPAPAPIAAAPVQAPAPEAISAATAPAQGEAAPVAQAAVAFDPHQFGDLTDIHDDDLEFVANAKRVDVDTIKRARRLQMMAKA